MPPKSILNLVEETHGLEKARKKTHGLEKATAMPPKGWDNRGARDITADEYKYLLWLSRRQRGKARHDVLRGSIAAMSDDQKLYLQELATNDRRLSLLAFLSPD